MHKLETRPYQVNPNSVSSYIYQQTMPKNKEPFPWILQELDALTRISRPYYTEDPIIIPLKPMEPLPDAGQQQSPLCEILAASNGTSMTEETTTSISELDYMLRRELEETTMTNTTEETTDWTVLDSIGITTFD